MRRPFRDGLRCRGCGHEYRLHTATPSQGSGAYDESCTACVRCEAFVPAFPLVKVKKSVVNYTNQKCRAGFVRKKNGWENFLVCGHAYKEPRRLSVRRCPACEGAVSS